mgnify:FL=1
MHTSSDRGDRMIIAQISDMHLRDNGMLLKQKINTEVALEKTIDHINSWETPPHAILVTGDLVQRAKRQNYANLRKKLDQLPSPYYVIPGNHDNRTLMCEHFSDLGYLPDSGTFLQYSVDTNPLRLIGIDTIIPGKNEGEICSKRCKWLQNVLHEKADQPTLIFMHHPPFKTGVNFLDRHQFQGSELLANVIERNPQVIRIVCGHLHRQLQVTWAGTIASVSPSIAFQLPMPLGTDADKGFSLEPPACPVFIWQRDIGLVAHMSLIGDFGGLQPFVGDPIV